MKYWKQLNALGACPFVKGAYLAGGAVLSAFSDQPINDYDLYFKSEKDFVEAILGAYDDGYWCVSATDRAVTFVDGGVTMQFMRFEFFDSAQKIFDAFDFTCCMGAVDMDKWGRGTMQNDECPFILHDDFLPSAAAKRLTFHSGTRFPIASAMRVVKYTERGFKIDKQNMLALALTCAGVNIDSWETLKKQIGGIYGDRIVVSETGTFSLNASIAEIQTEPAINDNYPEDDTGHLASAERLLEYLGIPLPADYAS